MPKRCANCGSFAPRAREMAVPGGWLSYLRSERGLSAPVGTLKMPLCADCYPEVDGRRGDDDPPADLLDGLDLGALVDEGT